MDLYNNFNNLENSIEIEAPTNNSYEYNNDKKDFSKKNNLLNRAIDFLSLKPENNRLDIGGLSIGVDSIIILAIIFFLVTDSSTDILLIICLGLSLLNVNLNPFG